MEFHAAEIFEGRRIQAIHGQSVRAANVQAWRAGGTTTTVVHVDVVLAESKDMAVMIGLRELSIQNLGGFRYYMECHLKGERSERTLKVDEHVYKVMVDRFDVTKISPLPASTGGHTLSIEIAQTRKKKRAGWPMSHTGRQLGQ